MHESNINSRLSLAFGPVVGNIELRNPAGNQLYGDGSGCVISGRAAIRFNGAQRDCVPCTHRDRCLLTPQKTKVRQVAFFQGKADGTESYTDKMKVRIDSPEGRIAYGRRFATVEPVSPQQTT